MKLLMIIKIVFCSILVSNLMGAEAHLMVAPKVSSKNFSIKYMSEYQNFFGTHLYLIKNVFSKKISSRDDFKDKKIVVEVELIPKTSIFKITVNGADEATDQNYINQLMEEFVKYKKQDRDKFFDDRIRSLENALKSDIDQAIKDKIVDEINETKVAKFIENDEFIRID